VQSSHAPVNRNLMELLLMIDAAKGASAHRIIAEIPPDVLQRTAAGQHRIALFDLQQVEHQGVLHEPTDVGAVLFARAAKLLDALRDEGPFRLVGLAAYDLEVASATRGQLELLPAAGGRALRARGE